MPTTTAIAQTLSISTSLLAAGSMASFSVFDTPMFKSQPASRSLPSIRWLFSRGSHIFPQAAVLSSAGFAYLAINALPAGHALNSIINLGSNGAVVNGYLAAAGLCIGIFPFTTVVMVPTNFTIMDINKEKGGARSEGSAKEKEIREFTDLTGPQGETGKRTTEEEDQRVRELLERFGRLNAARAVLMGVGGVVGLFTALA
ncbi:hypothetical protein ACLMJK_008721 [Lecanora helva]